MHGQTAGVLVAGHFAEHDKDAAPVVAVDDAHAPALFQTGEKDAGAGVDSSPVAGGDFQGQPRVVDVEVGGSLEGNGGQVESGGTGAAAGRDDGVGMGLGEFDLHGASFG